ncbi:DUF6227 family protein [Streptomyces sp. V4-01]|uniref:DUF6227 family protein n=1 Tax=Actinacidiphila polyblastidii TaxID=3110430 RepID=A0ABU7PAR9_9ACTN|nr:DUF6227 family protein [Streptomyces sp. V4-01]
MDAEPARAEDAVRAGGGPAQQLAALLARAENGRQAALSAPDAKAPLMHHRALQSCRHAKGDPRPMNRRTYRHSFLLPDGGVRVLWELEHDTGPDGTTTCAVFADREDLAVAEWQVDAAFGGSGGPPELPPGAQPPWQAAGTYDFGRLTDTWAAEAGPFAAPPFAEPPFAEPPSPEPPFGELPPAGPRQALRRTYTEGDSPEHARRLLRRATNAEATGDDVRDRLRTAIAHGISIVARRSTVVAGRPVSWSLYEHAFLLLDGGELSLWELDHTRTPSGDPECEVHGSQDAALDAAVRRIEAG